MVIRKMYDSVTPANCPTDGDLYAGYIDGRYANLGTFAARFPGRRLISITIWNGTADVLDVERGDATPLMVPDWSQRMRSLNRHPTCYCSLSAWPDVQRACANARVVLPDWWAAGYYNPPRPYLPAGAVACQWVDWGPYDQSFVSDAAFPLTSTQPTPAPVLPPTIITGQPQGDNMVPHYVHVPQLDSDGNGAVDIPIPKSTIVSILENGYDPISNKRYAKQATFAPLAISPTSTRVVIEGGDSGSGGGLDFTVWTTS